MTFTLTEIFLISLVVLFTLNLLVLIAFVGPLLREIRSILQDARQITQTVQARIRKVDETIDQASAAFNVMKIFSAVVGKFSGRKKRKDDYTDY